MSASAPAAGTCPTPTAPAVGCCIKCAAAPSGGMCGGGGANSIMEIKCVSEWGRDTVLIICFSAAVYLLGGIVYAQRQQPTAKFEIRTSLSSHPHFAAWLQLPGLCADGCSLTKATLLRLKATYVDKVGYEGVAAAEEASAEQAAAAEPAAAGSDSGTDEEGSGSGSD